MARKSKSKFVGKFKGKVSKNSERRRKEGLSFGYLSLPKGIQLFREPPGKREQFDILPYTVTDPNHMDRDDKNELAIPGEPWYTKPFRVHRRCIGVNNGDAVCPTTIGKRCPICEYRAKRLREGADYQDDEIKTLRYSLRNLYAIVPKKSNTYSEQVHIWNISQFLFQAKLDEELGEDEERETFPDPENGWTLRVRFSEEKFGSITYADTSRIDFREREESYSAEYLQNVPNLDEILIIHSYKELEQKFYELDDEPGAEEEIEQEENDTEQREDNQTKSRNKSPSEYSYGDKCPHGYRFGIDCEEYEECDDCDWWEECSDAKESNE